MTLRHFRLHVCPCCWNAKKYNIHRRSHTGVFSGSRDCPTLPVLPLYPSLPSRSFHSQPLLWLLTAMRSPLLASLLALTLSIASSKAAISSTEQMPLNVSFSLLDNSESQDVRINKKRRELFHSQKLTDLLILALHLFSFERTVPTHYRYPS